MHAPKNRLVKREKMLILLPILLPVYETIITGKSEPCLVLGVRIEIKVRDRSRSIDWWGNCPLYRERKSAQN